MQTSKRRYRAFDLRAERKRERRVLRARANQLVQDRMSGALWEEIDATEREELDAIVARLHALGAEDARSAGGCRR